MPEMELTDSVPKAEPVVATPAPTPAPEATPSPTPQPEPVPTPAPADPTPAPVHEDPKPADPEPTPAPQLFKLPDGRTVDAAGLQREYENLLPEFTRKSQELAALKTQNQPLTNEQPAWKDPNYAPTTWAEAIEIAKAEAIAEFGRKAAEAQAEETAVRTQVETQVAELKVTDPKLDEDALFNHALKYGFRDLKQAYSNMQEMKTIATQTEQRVLKNLQTRAADPVATNPTPPPVAVPKAQEYEPGANSGYRSALDFLDALKSKH